MSAIDYPFEIENFSWPRAGAKLFDPDRPRSLPALLESGPSNWWRYAESYRSAAEALVEKFRQTGYDQDFLALPVLFLYRHYAEVSLKLLEIEAHELLGRQVSDAIGHRLPARWRRLRAALEEIWPGQYHDDLAAVEEMVTQLDAVDPGSTTFRYPVNVAGMSSLPPALERFDLLHFGTEMEAFGHWVGGVADAIAARRDAAAEMRREFVPSGY